jgi:glycosyltransferase involved in cell wall biosynthesis
MNSANKKTPDLHVLHVCEAFSTGVLQSISQICRLTGDDIVHSVLHGRRWETPEDFASRFPNGVRFHEWGVVRALNPLADARAARQLRQMVAERKPDVVHAHSSKAGALVRLALPGTMPKVLYSPRGFGFLRQDASASARLFYRAVEWFLGRGNATVIACGLGEEQVARSVARQVLRINNMLDLSDFNGIEPRRASHRPLRIAMSGSIRPQKNFPLFADIADRLANSGMSFVWIGGGTPASNAPLPGNLEITGMLPRHQALRQLASCDVFMQTSLWEGLPVAVLEAMALNLAVLAKPAVGNTELIDEGRNGWLCEDANAFVARLQQLDADRALLAAMGARARDMIESEYDATAIAGQWRDIYTAGRR